MFDINPYTLRTKTVRGVTEYYVSFKDGQDIEREVKVTLAVYSEFLRFVKTERNLRRWAERHIEQSCLSCENLFKRALYPQKSAEDAVFDKLRDDKVKQIINSLTVIQKRRFILYHEFNMTYEEIAEIEDRSPIPVFRSIKQAEAKIIKEINYFDRHR